MNNTRFIGVTSPVITFTKWHDTENKIIYYDLYLNGKVDGRYTLTEFQKRMVEIAYDV